MNKPKVAYRKVAVSHPLRQVALLFISQDKTLHPFHSTTLARLVIRKSFDPFQNHMLVACTTKQSAACSMSKITKRKVSKFFEIDV
ncbi:hypothetical protein [Aeromonas enteropelogenes]|uniref:hypothetical protein n=1 Tax=Aeromonas enteropelogenes TaxID=29489 RepID=UPI003BA3CF60